MTKSNNLNDMKAQPVSGYFEWLETKGAYKVFENAVGHNLKEAKSVYLFKSQDEAQKFKTNYLPDGDYGEVFMDQRFKQYAVPVNKRAQEALKNKFEKEIQKPVNFKDFERQLDLIEKAESKLEYNNVEVGNKGTYRGMNYGLQVKDRVSYVSEMLKNGGDGWFSFAAASAIDIMLSAYIATNSHILSQESIEKFTNAQKTILEIDENGHFTGGWKANANFNNYLQTIYGPSGDATVYGNGNKETRVGLIRENTNLLLNGGFKKIIDSNTPVNLTSIAGKENDLQSHKQPRFFPDKEGKSETNAIVLEAGGMQGHTALRILKKEEDKSIPGGFKYYYTKVDAGAGTEELPFDKDAAYELTNGIYTTEITPYYKTKILANNKIGLEVDDNTGKPIPLSSQEITRVNANPELYKQHMEATLASLVNSEQEIIFYAKTKEIRVHHGEKVDLTQKKFDEWAYHNNKIEALRGEVVPERTLKTPAQKSGNCSVYSAVLAVVSQVGDPMGYDIMQNLKLQENEMRSAGMLNVRKNEIESQKEVLQGIASVLGVDNKIEYKPGQRINISFANELLAQQFQNQLESDYKIKVKYNNTPGQKNFDISMSESDFQNICKINSLKLIQNFPNFKDIEVKPHFYRSLMGYETYQIILLPSKEEAERFQNVLRDDYSVGSRNFNDKVREIVGQDKFGVVLPDADYRDLAQKLREKGVKIPVAKEAEVIPPIKPDIFPDQIVKPNIISNIPNISPNPVVKEAEVIPPIKPDIFPDQIVTPNITSNLFDTPLTFVQSKLEPITPANIRNVLRINDMDSVTYNDKRPTIVFTDKKRAEEFQAQLKNDFNTKVTIEDSGDKNWGVTIKNHHIKEINRIISVKNSPDFSDIEVKKIVYEGDKYYAVLLSSEAESNKYIDILDKNKVDSRRLNQNALRCLDVIEAQGIILTESNFKKLVSYLNTAQAESLELKANMSPAQDISKTWLSRAMFKKSPKVTITEPNPEKAETSKLVANNPVQPEAPKVKTLVELKPETIKPEAVVINDSVQPVPDIKETLKQSPIPDTTVPVQPPQKDNIYQQQQSPQVPFTPQENNVYPDQQNPHAPFVPLEANNFQQHQNPYTTYSPEANSPPHGINIRVELSLYSIVKDFVKSLIKQVINTIIPGKVKDTVQELQNIHTDVKNAAHELQDIRSNVKNVAQDLHNIHAEVKNVALNSEIKIDIQGEKNLTNDGKPSKAIFTANIGRNESNVSKILQKGKTSPAEISKEDSEVNKGGSHRR